MLRLPLLLALSACSGPAADKPAIDTDTAVVPCEVLVWHADGDGDGYGDPLATIEVCEPPGREVLDGTDCDDTNAAAFPGAPEDCTTTFDANCDGSSGYADADGDGTAACEDCDDANPAVYPGALERCDDVDGDCDGTIDEDAVDGRIYYPDADGDTFGDLALAERLCAMPEGWGTTFTDCDDADAAVNPDATELCNTIDDDCDGTVDEGDAADAVTYYDDDDGDGYGDAGTRVTACAAPGGSTTVGGDCEDGEPGIHPGAAEVCNDIDDDCSGVIDGDDATDPTTWYFDGDGDGWGDTDVTADACDLPARYVAVDGDCDDGDATAAPDISETCDGSDDDCDGAVDEDDAVDAPTWYVDLDGDGYGDPAVAVVGCEAPAATGWSLRPTDCDDSGGASPATPETCNGIDDDCDGTVDEDDAADAATWYADVDGDGFGDAAAQANACAVPDGHVADASDCDDADAAISPAEVELCDGEDDDCDGTADEDDAADAPTWYADVDGDTFGDDASATTACAEPGGHVSVSGDCDDDDASFHPGAAEADCDDPADYNCDGSVGETDADADGWMACEDCNDAAAAISPAAAETCNDLDDDCDGDVDEPGAVGAGTWYADADGDTYGDAAVTDRSCTLPSGFVEDGTDCDDTAAATHPGARELCATAWDDDCDGDTDELRTSDCTRYYLDFDEDGFGSTSNVCACHSIDPFTADNTDDCDDGSEAVNPDATEVTGNGVDDNCDDLVDVGLLADADAVLAGDVVDGSAGVAVAGGADVNGDGYDDLLVAAFTDSTPASEAGRAFLLLGPVRDTTLGTGADAILSGEGVDDHAGYSVALGDADGDGYADALVGATGNGSGGRDSGIAYLLYGPFSGNIDLASADAYFQGAAASDVAGVSVGFAGDLDGDGVGDLVVGASGADTGASASGSVYVITGPPAASLSLGSADAELYGTGRSDAAGRVFSPAGDTNGDGFADFLVGVYGDDDNGSGSGTTFLLEGPTSGVASLNTASSAQLVGGAAGDNSGTSVASAGDTDGDGYDDVLVGANSAGTGGEAYLLLAPLSGRVYLTSADATFESATTGDLVGCSVAGPGDLDGDGRLDVVIGAYGHDGGGSLAGGAFAFMGALSGTYDLTDASEAWYGDAGDRAGAAMAAAGDTDGDGLPQVLVGAYDAEVLAGGGGAAYLVSW